MDPFSETYNALWSIVEANEDMKNLVRPGNRIKFVKDGPDHDPRSSSGMVAGNSPELLLIPDYFASRLAEANNGAVMVRQFNWTIRTSDILIGKQLFPLEYALWLAMKQARKDLPAQVAKVRSLELPQGSQALPPVEAGGAWLSIWSVEVHYNL